MRRKLFLNTRPIFIVFILAICLCAIGAGYAAWTQRLNINAHLLAGEFDVIFDEERPFSAEIMSIGSAQAKRALDGNIACYIMDEEKRQVSLCFEGTLPLNELLNTDNVLVFHYSLVIGEESTIRSIVPSQADMYAPSAESLESVLTDSKLVIDGSEYLMPESLRNYYDTLHWNVYRKVEAEQDLITAVVLLKLSEESIAVLNNANDFSLDIEELSEEMKSYITSDYGETSGELRAEIDIAYLFTIPLFVEQGR